MSVRVRSVGVGACVSVRLSFCVSQCVHLSTCHVELCRAMSCHATSWQAKSNQVKSSHDMSCQFNSIQFNSIQFNSIQFNSIQVRSGQVRSGQVRSGRVASRRVASRRVASRRVASRRVASFHVTSSRGAVPCTSAVVVTVHKSRLQVRPGAIPKTVHGPDAGSDRKSFFLAKGSGSRTSSSLQVAGLPNTRGQAGVANADVFVHWRWRPTKKQAPAHKASVNGCNPQTFGSAWNN